VTEPDRLGAYLRGLSAESRAALLLRLKGFRILARRFAAPVGEIDLVALRGRTLAFVEVKARRDLAAGLDAIRPQQRARIRRGAEAFLARHPRLATCDMRFDVVVVVPGRLPRHLPNAFGI
jgi:putative endonuclease